MYIHCTLVPMMRASGELKTKPTQHSVKELRSLGIQPDVIVCRTEYPLSEELKNKIALFCDIDREAVIEVRDAETLYEVPLMIQEQGLDEIVVKRLGLECGPAEMSEWLELVNKVKNLTHQTRIAIVGKYVALHDAYMSVVEALRHAGFDRDTEIDLKWVNSEDVSDSNVHVLLGDVDGILVPGGFGDRGIEGKISAIRYAREQRIPFLGICLGMQMVCVEGARNLLKLEGAHSAEFDASTPHPIIDLLPEQKRSRKKAAPCAVACIRASWFPTASHIRHTDRIWCTNAIAIVTNSTMNTGKRWRKWDTCSRELPRTEDWSRLWSTKIIRGLWLLSSIRNLYHVRRVRNRCSVNL